MNHIIHLIRLPKKPKSAPRPPRVNKPSQPSDGATLQEDEEILAPVKTVDIKVGIAIQKARSAKKLTQKDLATLINEKVKSIADFENGSAPINNAILGKLERALDVKLRGKNIGAPLEHKK
ncbi:Multiprotein-bridging factor 1 [Thelohanellus kitauei]|uniref:Multiprotein-bridging factor 1 n=1 Tax=Thelohanellus kitauei TaxID=669202 RepID=A0A0C2MUA5_THEKT|nr:Multiprotein-bridging factor 1 [Thelohanellus kitauei]